MALTESTLSSRGKQMTMTVRCNVVIVSCGELGIKRLINVHFFFTVRKLIRSEEGEVLPSDSGGKPASNLYAVAGRRRLHGETLILLPGRKAMAFAEEEEHGFLDRTSRSTRGKRMTKLLDEEIDEDEQFWNQDALKEDENDDNYEEEQEVIDEYDSDFNDDEPEPGEEVKDEGDEREKTKKKLIFPGKLASKKKKKKKEKKVEVKPAPEEEPLTLEIEPEVQEAFDGTDRIVRKSTRTSVIVRQAERDAIRAALQATMKPIKRKKEGEEKKMTQEEMLLEAAQTEIRNLRNLERVLAMEEEVKKRAVVHKEVYSGPCVRYVSRDGNTFLELINGASFQSELCTAAPPYPEKAVCVVTGLPAKYRDPCTGLPYATLDAFKSLRERFRAGPEGQESGPKLGPLLSLVPNGGFATKSHRSAPPRRTVTSSAWGSCRL
ncbi:DNA binding protein SWC2 [Wolffia australiana]